MADWRAYVVLGAIFFALGLIGFVSRRNLIVMFLCTEMMFQGVIMNLVGLGYRRGGESYLAGQSFALFLLVIAAAEAALALGLVVLLYRRKGTLDAESWASLRG
jgi:NADH-quinone oxidoreductase subunit K